MATCKICGRDYSDQEAKAGFEVCEHCDGTGPALPCALQRIGMSSIVLKPACNRERNNE